MIAFVLLILLIGGTALGECAPLLYKVEDGKGHTLYLFGTIHVGEENINFWNDAVEKAYRESDALAVEIDLIDFMEDYAAMLRYSQTLLYPNVLDSAPKHLSSEAYELGVKLLDASEAQLKRMRPLGWISLAQEKCYALAKLNSAYGADMLLLSRAHDEGKRVDSLESMEAQLDMLLNQSDGFEEFQLTDMLLHPQENADAIRALYDAWCSGEEEKLIRVLEEEKEALPEQWKEEYEAYAHALYTERDAAFLQDALSYLESGETVFFAVGAAHIVRPGAVKDQLARMGCIVTEIGR